MTRVAVMGAGVMGLAAAYHALNAGYAVEVFEADRVAGGMASHFDFDGLSIERFYHFVCKGDKETFKLMNELGIGEALRWRGTSMGYFINGKQYPWGDPVALLQFPLLNISSKLRYGAQMFYSTKQTDWSKLEKMSAKEWFTRWIGEEAYEVLWRRLFDLKFHEYADEISAAWMWTRIKRIGNSRRSLWQEELGYIEGGTATLVNALVDAIIAKGGRIRLGYAVEEVVCEFDKVVGLRANNKLFSFDRIISTVPTPYISRLVPKLSVEMKSRFDSIANIGVVCVVMKLKRSVTKHFWLNISDEHCELPGFIEFSNLRPIPATVVYAPYYTPVNHARFLMPDETIVAQTLGYLKRINPSIQDCDLLSSIVGRLRYAQPICEVGFLEKIPPVVPSIAGLQVADTCYYYPEDRGISESLRFGRKLAAGITNPEVWRATRDLPLRTSSRSG